ncbi:MAG: MalY/PatB family protein [Aquiluna sp.]
MTNSHDSFGNFANRSSSKWRRFPDDILPMHVAEMDFDVAQPIRQRLVEMVNNSDLGYLGPLPELAPAFAGFAKRKWNWEIDQSAIKLATDVGVAAVEILRSVGRPRDKVLINSPVYASFFKWILEVKMVPHDAPLRLVGDRWSLDLAAIEKAFSEGVKIYLLCSPQNPVGTVHTKEELQEVARLAEKFDVVVISDEIHAPLAWVPFTPLLSVGSAAENQTVTITSSSKAWNTAGLKAGFLITQSKKMQERMRDLPEAMNWRASLLGAFSMVEAYTNGEVWLNDTVIKIQENLTFLRFELAKQLPKAKFFDMSATYLAWLDLSAYGLDNLQGRLLQDAKVSVVAGPDHSPDSRYADFVRFNFATSQPRIAEAIRRMAGVLEV